MKIREYRLCAICAMLWTVPLMASQLPSITNSDEAVQSLLNRSKKTTVTINNQAFTVVEPVSKVRTLVQRPSVAAVANSQVQITPGTVIQHAATGDSATVSGRLSVLFHPGVDVKAFTQSYGLTVYQQLGQSRLYLLEAGPGVDLLALARTLSVTSETEAVKLELVSRLMKPL
ncbi:hypothetical protein [Candidatus Sororendozoicomonas aggregata]|uniref:hypothetical protein n=1 Tax=Candidatus Sororendozoicomonas aggregata TaxID=3073239 RepID=UPI002ED503F6